MTIFFNQLHTYEIGQNPQTHRKRGVENPKNGEKISLYNR